MITPLAALRSRDSIKTADIVVYRDGDYAVAVDRYGNELISSTDHAKVLQEAINKVGKDGGGKVYIFEGTYLLQRPIYLQQFNNEQGIGDVIHNQVIIEGTGKSTVLMANAQMEGVIVGRAMYTRIRGLYLHGQGLAEHGYYFALEDRTPMPSRMVFQDIYIHGTTQQGFYSRGLYASELWEVESDTGIYIYVEGDYMIVRNSHSGVYPLEIGGTYVKVDGGVYRGVRFIGGTVIELHGLWLGESNQQYAFKIDNNVTNVLVESSLIELREGNIMITSDLQTPIEDRFVIKNSRIRPLPNVTNVTLIDLANHYNGCRDDVIIEDSIILHVGNITWESDRNQGLLRLIRTHIYDASTTPATHIFVEDGYMSSKKRAKRGQTYITGDGTTTDFTIVDISDFVRPNAVIAQVSPTAPFTYKITEVYLADDDGDGLADHVHVVLDNAPASGEKVYFNYYVYEY